jgi:hypothetical protein
MKRVVFQIVPAILLSCASVFAQDFGFGAAADAPSGDDRLSVKIGGEVAAELLGYTDDFSGGAGDTRLGDIFSGKLNFSAGNSFGDAVINLNLAPGRYPASVPKDASPVTFDEAYLRLYFGAVEIEGGYRKLAWGKADSFGPLDVTNPFDYTEITDLRNISGMKIARPLVHVSARIGQSSKLEAVFIPTFEPYRFAESGRWEPAQMAGLREAASSLLAKLPAQAQAQATIPEPNKPDTSTLNYAQMGVRFTTTIGSSDMGAQYYYGRLPRPAFRVNFGLVNVAPAPVPVPASVDILYNPYHQIGLDYARVIAGFNVRAEFAANITEDSAGDDGSVYNSALAWSLGFDRDLLWGVNLNFQCNETARLRHDKIASNPLLDIEADTDVTTTQLTAVLSKKILRDELELRLAAVCEIEESDYIIMPALVWTKDAVEAEFSAGFFGGDKKGQFGQYHKNSFIKAVLTYSF